MQLLKAPFEIGLVKSSPPASLVPIAPTDPGAGDGGEPAAPPEAEASLGPRDPGWIISGLVLIRSGEEMEREGRGKSC